MQYKSSPVARGLKGTITLPGDKSISHRALLLAAIAEGRSQIQGLLMGEDNLHTLNALRQLGVTIDILDTSMGKVCVQGVGLYGLCPADAPLDLGNAGTGMRLMAGLLAGQAFSSTLIGDASLCQRPMGRIITPLKLMGASIVASPQNTAPLHIKSATLRGIYYQSPIASAQVKSCLLLAGLYAKGALVLREPALSRDHTERMLLQMGVPLQIAQNQVMLQAPTQLQALNITIPGDFSSAAFFIVAASIIPSSSICLTGVGINPTRIGLIHILQAMGADISVHPNSDDYEPTATITINYAPLRGIMITPEQVVGALDEFPIIFIAAAVAKGATKISGLGELTVKESNRLAVMAQLLTTLGITCRATQDSIHIEGGVIRGGKVAVANDHRIAMAALIAGAVAQAPVVIDDATMIATSFPTFMILAEQLGLQLSQESVHE